MENWEGMYITVASFVSAKRSLMLAWIPAYLLSCRPS